MSDDEWAMSGNDVFGEDGEGAQIGGDSAVSSENGSGSGAANAVSNGIDENLPLDNAHHKEASGHTGLEHEKEECSAQEDINSHPQNTDPLPSDTDPAVSDFSKSKEEISPSNPSTEAISASNPSTESASASFPSTEAASASFPSTESASASNPTPESAFASNPSTESASASNPTLHKAQDPSISTESNESNHEKSHISQETRKHLAEDAEFAVVETTGNANPHPGESAPGSVAERLRLAEAERDQIQASYNALLNKLLSMKAFFGKMKETERELDQVRSSLETANDERQAAIDVAVAMKRDLAAAQKEAQQAKLETEKALAAADLLRGQVGDLNAECDRLSQSLTSTRRELAALAEQLQDEKYTLEHKCNALEKKSAADRKNAQAFETSRDEYKAEAMQLRETVEELRALNESLEALAADAREKVKLLSQTLMSQHDSVAQQAGDHAQELERLHAEVEQARACEARAMDALAAKQAQLDAATNQISAERQAASDAKADLAAKAKTIGQLRHELVTANEHLTKALTMLKKQGTSHLVVDRQLISNVFISFLQLARGDAKKFQALQLIAALLEWDDLQKVAAGLSHGQNSAAADLHRRQSFISLWTEYLEKESS